MNISVPDATPVLKYARSTYLFLQMLKASRLLYFIRVNAGTVVVVLWSALLKVQ